MGSTIVIVASMFVLALGAVARALWELARS